MSAALGTLYPDVKMISGIDVIYTVQMMLYTSTSARARAR